ncbi:MAG: hypothetical protein K8L91_03145 [Anaerolineae bacterium]|nr:hypothetical protein [Anaerolineae bacterium]
MKSNHLPLLRLMFLGLVLLLVLHLPGTALADCCTSNHYYYIFTGFSGTCLDDGSGNVVVSGSFLREAYLPVNNVNTYTVNNPAFAGSFSLAAVGTETNGQYGNFLINHTSAPGVAPLSVSVTIATQADGAAIGSTTAVATCSSIGAVPTVSATHTYSSLGSRGAGNIYDGRLNTDAGAPAIVYPGSIRIFAYDPVNCVSELVLTISDETIESVGVPAENTVLGRATNPFSNHAIVVYRLTTGEFQMNTSYADGKLYIFAWNEDATHRYYPSY